MHSSGGGLVHGASAPLFSANLTLLLVCLGFDEEFRKAWLPFFCRSGHREASLEEFDAEAEGWLLSLREISLPPLTGEDLAS